MIGCIVRRIHPTVGDTVRIGCLYVVSGVDRGRITLKGLDQSVWFLSDAFEVVLTI